MAASTGDSVGIDLTATSLTPQTSSISALSGPVPTARAESQGNLFPSTRSRTGQARRSGQTALVRQVFR